MNNSYFCSIKRLLFILILAFVTLSANAQFTDGSTGLLSAPSAQTYDAGTFFITNNFLNEKLLPPDGWDYSSFGYSFGISFFSRLEIAYSCTLFWGDWSPHAQGPEGTDREKIMKNQDRHLSSKILLTKENEFGLQWMPAIAVGVRDIDSGMFTSHMQSSGGNGFFTCLYAVASKTFPSPVGEFSGHVGYQYNRRPAYRFNAPCVAVTWRPIWLENRWFNPNFILEYDSRTFNFGFISSIWDNRFEAMFELQNFQWISFGLRYNVRLAGAE